MAHTCTVSISNVRTQSKQIDITYTFTDGADVFTVDYRNVSADQHDKPLSQIRGELKARAYADYQAVLAGRTAIGTLISGWEGALAADVNALIGA